jgi:hypothetical protein
MHARVQETVEVRCNFCFNWISGKTLIKKNLNACEECLQKYIIPGFVVHTVTGEVYRLLTSKDSEARETCSKSFIENLFELRSHEQDRSEKCDEFNDVIQ